MTAGQIAATVAKLRAVRALDRGDTRSLGIGCMTDASWQRTRDFLVRAKLLDERADWRSAYTTELCTTCTSLPNGEAALTLRLSPYDALHRSRVEAPRKRHRDRQQSP